MTYFGAGIVPRPFAEVGFMLLGWFAALSLSARLVLPQSSPLDMGRPDDFSRVLDPLSEGRIWDIQPGKQGSFPKLLPCHATAGMFCLWPLRACGEGNWKCSIFLSVCFWFWPPNPSGLLGMGHMAGKAKREFSLLYGVSQIISWELYGCLMCVGAQITNCARGSRWHQFRGVFKMNIVLFFYF